MTPLLALAALLAVQDRDDPETELKSFKVADGFEVNLFASEKDGIVKPLQIRWDPQGRLWVTCGPSYPQLRPGEVAEDSIVLLQDTDGDGRADKSRVFVKGLSTPMGLEIGRGGVFVGSGGELLHYKDSGSEGRSPEKSVILKGFFTADSHQNINSFVWGPRGEMMFCQGLHATARVETPWGVEKLEKAGVWRLRDRDLRLDPFLGYDMGPQNPYGIAFDDWGQPIVVAGNGQGIYYPLPAMIRSTHFLQIGQIWDKTIKIAGVDVLSGAAWPEDLHGVMVGGAFLNNAVAWFRLVDDGAGFRAKDLPALIVSSHSSFRPVDVRVGPDGAIYIADWYNPIIGHYQASFRHPDRDKSHGRIWRVTAKGRAPVKQPDLVSLSAAGLVEQLRSPERWTRYQAHRLLADRDPKDVLAALGPWAGGVGAEDRVIIDALGVYESLDAVEPGLLKRMLRSKEPRIRAYATGAITRWHDRLPDALDLLAAGAADDHPRVRLEAVVAASYVPDPRAVEVAAIVADRAMDRFLTHALTQAVHALKPHWKPAFDAGTLTFGNRAERIQAVLKADGTGDVVQALLSLLNKRSLSAEVRASALVLLAATGGPDELPVVLKDPVFGKETPEALSLAGRILDELAGSHRARRVVPSGDWTDFLRVQLNRPLRPKAMTLVGLWRVRALWKDVVSLMKDEESHAAGVEALADLGDNATLSSMAVGVPGRGERFRRLATAALIRVNLPGAAQAAGMLLSEAAAAGETEPLVAAFLSRQGGSEALAGALGTGKIPADTAKLGLRALSSAGRQDETLRAVLSKAAGIKSAAPEYSVDFVKALGEEAMKEGDAARGEKVFRGTVTNCFSCHAIGGAGGKVGPDVSAVGTGLPVDLVIESVLWPNRQVKEGYSSTAVITKGDLIVQGFKVNEDKQTLILRDPNLEQPIRIAIADIKARKEVGSVMPEGLANGLTRAELRDLVRFLCDLGKPGPFRLPDRPLVRRWLVADAAGARAQKFSTVAGELPREDLGTAREVSFEVEVLQEGRFTLGVTPGKPSIVELSRGRHVVTIPVEAGGAALRCEVGPAPGSSAELRLVN